MPAFSRTALRQKLTACKVTLLLIVANVAVYIVAGFLDTRAFESLSHGSFLIDWGGNVPALTLSGEYWRLFTSMFLHVSFLHLAVNMLALWSIGMILEARMRWPVFLGTYLLTGLCSSLVSALWNRGELIVTCGASGAILGIFGAVVVYALHDRKAGRPHVPLGNIVFSLVLTFGAGAVFDIDNAAHVGGLLSGALLAVVTLCSERLRPVAAAVVLMVTAVIGVAALVGVTRANYDADMHDQIAIARFDQTLGDMGLLQPESAPGVSLSLDECIERILHGVKQGESQASDLRRCANNSDRQYELLSVFMPLRYEKCQAQVADLRELNADPATQEALSAIGRYCEIQTKLYAAVFRDAPTDLDLAEASRVRLTTRFLLDRSGQYRTNSDALNAQAAAMQRLLDLPGEMASAVVQQAGCPYWSCAR